MKVIVAGGRDFNNYKLLEEKLDFYFQNITPVIICGEARGADTLGRKYAEKHGLEVISFPAQWERYGKSAGFKRNEQMSQYADACIAFWDGKSKGTQHMIETMRKKRKIVRVVQY